MILSLEILNHIQQYNGSICKTEEFLRILKQNHKDITLVGDKNKITKEKRFLFILSTDDMDAWSFTTEIGIFIGKIDLGIKKQFQIEYNRKGDNISLWKEGVYILIVDIDVNKGVLEKEIDGMKSIYGDEGKGIYIEFMEIQYGKIYMNCLGNDEMFSEV